MSVDDRVEETQKLRTKICQDFFKIVLKQDWKDNITQIYKENLKHYKEQYKIVKLKGLNSYNINDFDVSHMWSLFCYHPEIFIESTNSDVFADVKECFKSVDDDRNGVSHLSYNESKTELYEKVRFSLPNLKKFIISIKNLDNIDKSKIEVFYYAYNEKINELSEAVKNEESAYNIREKKIKEYLRQIKISPNQLEKYDEIYCDNYANTHIKNLSKNQFIKSDENEIYCFVKAVYDEGFSFALDDYISILNGYRYFKELEKLLLGIATKDDLSLKSADQIIKTINDHLAMWQDEIDIFVIFDKMKEKGYHVRSDVESYKDKYGKNHQMRIFKLEEN